MARVSPAEADDGPLMRGADVPTCHRDIEIFKQSLHPSHPKLKLCEQNYEQLLREMN